MRIIMLLILTIMTGSILMIPVLQARDTGAIEADVNDQNDHP